MSQFKLHLEQMHPGVAEMDAVYRFYVEHNNKRSQPGDPVFLLSVTDPEVKVNGCDVIVPYSVRQSGRDVVVTAELNDYVGGVQSNEQGKCKAKDTYTLQFKTNFSEKPSFFDDFNTYDLTKWEEGWEYGLPGGRVEDSDLVLEIKREGVEHNGRRRWGAIVSTANSFTQAFGCFSARMKFPEYGTTPRTCNCAFWLCSNVLHPETIMYKRNPEADPKDYRCHAGEIDIVEYSPAFGDYTSASVHWNGWCKYHKFSGLGGISAPGIREGYHTLSLVWEPGALYWYYDGNLIRVYNGEGMQGVGEEPGAEMAVLLQTGVHRNADGAWKGTWIGQGRNEDYPTQFRIDWVKVHALKR